MAAIGHKVKRGLDKGGLIKGAKQDPELYVLGAIMTAGFGLVGWHFSSHPTSALPREKNNRINIVKDTEPWHASDEELEKMGKDYKYKYHPHADYRNEPRNAPSALNSVIVPNVTLPKSVHDKFNKYGRDDVP